MRTKDTQAASFHPGGFEEVRAESDVTGGSHVLKIAMESILFF